MRNLIIAGLTASGKSTQAKRLAGVLGLRYVSGSAIRAELLGISAETRADSQFWLDRNRGGAMDRERLVRNDPRDTDVEEELIAMARAREGCAFDTWVMPWLFHEQSLCVYLRSPSRTRARRLCTESSDDSFENVLQKLEEKDSLARQFFLETYGVDIVFDMSPFDVVIDSGDRAEDAPGQIASISHHLATISRLAFSGDVAGLQRVILSLEKIDEHNVQLWISPGLPSRVDNEGRSKDGSAKR